MDAVAAPSSPVQVRLKPVPLYPSSHVALHVSVVFFPLQSPILPFVGAVGSSHVAA